MVRVEVWGEESDAPEMRSQIEEKGFKPLRQMWKPRMADQPESEEEWWEERYQHEDGSVLRFFPLVLAKNPKTQRRDLRQALIIEFIPEQVAVARSQPPKKKGKK